MLAAGIFAAIARDRSRVNAAKLAQQLVPVVLDPVFDHFASGEAADDDDGPGRLAAGGSDAFPRAALGSAPSAAPCALVAGEEDVVQGEGGIGEGGEEAGHGISPGREAAQRAVAEP